MEFDPVTRKQICIIADSVRCTFAEAAAKFRELEIVARVCATDLSHFQHELEEAIEKLRVGELEKEFHFEPRGATHQRFLHRGSPGNVKSMHRGLKQSRCSQIAMSFVLWRIAYPRGPPRFFSSSLSFSPIYHGIIAMPHPSSELKYLMDTAETNTLMKSKKHCHAKNVSSVVFKDNVGMLTRAFLAWPGHQLHENELCGGSMPVGIHDHKYNLELKRVVGRVQSVEYVKGSRGPLLKHWCFASGQATNPPEIGLRGYANLDEIIRFDLDDHFMPLHYQRLHNIVCCEEKAAWIVRERDTVQFVTNLFTREESLTFDGLYEPFDSADEVRQHVADFMKL